MPERILVTGATGKLGSEIVRRLHDRGETVRAATRFPARAATLFGPQVEVVEMDYVSTETWDNAVQWVDRLFLMPPPFDPHAFETLAPFLDWAVASGTGKVVLLSAMAIEHRSDLPLPRLEGHLRSLGVGCSILRPNLYMQNLATGLIGRAVRETGKIQLCAGEGAVSFVDAADVAAVAVDALTGSSLDGSIVTLTGPEAFGFDAVARLIADAADKTVTYEAVSPERMREILRAAHLADSNAAVATGLFESVSRGERATVTPDLPVLLGRPATDLAYFVASHASAWR